VKPERRRPLGRPRRDSRPPGAAPTPDRILEAAAELFCEAGFSKASMSAIAERADLTSGAIYAHFDSKADLLLAVVKSALEASPLSELAATDPAQRGTIQLPKLVSMYADPQRRRLRRLATEIHAAAVRNKDVAALLAEGNRRVVARYREEIERSAGSKKPDDPRRADHIARFLLILTMGLSHLDTLDPALIGDRDFQAWLEELVSSVLQSQGEETS